MPFDLNKYFADPANKKSDHGRLFARIVCNDGFSISVQANESAYCTPRTNEGPWYKVECGFPSAPPELIMQYAESPESPCDTVYGYVPVNLVEQLIELHGAPSQY